MHESQGAESQAGTRRWDAIDVHVHPWPSAGQDASSVAAMRAYFGRDLAPVTLDDLAEQYRSRRMLAVLLAKAAGGPVGLPSISNDEVAAAVRKHPDAFVGFGSVDPWGGQQALDEMRRIRETLGLIGLKFHPGLQRFSPNAPELSPLWQTAEDLGLICLFHTGMMGTGAGTPGGGGFKLRYTNPLLVDDVAADFPRLQVILAHPGWPWQAEQLAIARHKANVYLDLSGWSPKYFPEELVSHMGSLLQDKCLFGSDWPVITPERWLADFARLPLKDDVREKILVANALRLLNLG